MMILSIRVQETPLVLGMVLAFVGGILSFGSPCCLPLIPGYLGHLAGTTVTTEHQHPRRAVLVHGVAFVLGFSTVFTVAGIAIGQILTSVQAAQGYVRWVGGVIIILMGLHTTGLIKIPLLHRTFQMHPSLPTLPTGDMASGLRQSLWAFPALGRSFVVGVFFAAGWSPCVGPILTGIYGVVGMQPANGGILFFIYSLGLGVPFILIALLFGKLQGGLWRLNRYYNAVSLIGGLFLIFIGILLFTDTFSRLARYAPVINLPGVS